MYALNTYDERARRVTRAARQALAEPSPSISGNRVLHAAPETVAGLLGIWSMQTAVEINRRQASVQQEVVRGLVALSQERRDLDIQLLGTYPLFTGIKLVHGDISDVVIVPAEEDPLLTQGHFPLPSDVRQKLYAIERAGIPVEELRIYIAHEVPCNSVSAGGPIPLHVVAPPEPLGAVRTSERLGVIAHTATVTLLKGLRSVARVGAKGTAVGAAGSLAAASVVAKATAAVLLDPLIFGAITDERGLATWFVLAQWAW